MAEMHAYPGRTMGQLYHRFFRVNDLADGRFELGDREHRPRRRDRAGARRSPARATCSPRARPSTTSPRCCPTRPRSGWSTAPGGHLGVLTGRAAARTTWRALDAFLAETAVDGPARAPLPAAA